MFADTLSVRSGSHVQASHIFNRVRFAQDRPQLHRDFTWERHKVVSKVLNLRCSQFGLESLGSFKLLDHCRVVINAPLRGLVDLALIEQISDRHLPSVINHEVLKGYRSFKAEESVSKVEEEIKIAFLCEDASRLGSVT